MMFGLKLILLACLAIVPVLSAECNNNICCPVDWFGFHGHCYGYFAHQYTYEDARAYCQERGADLASIHSAHENTILNAFVRGATTWIGLSDLRIEGTYEWTDGTVQEYTNWATGQPDDYGSVEDCVELNNGGAPPTKWNDGQCGWTHGFLCKKSTLTIQSNVNDGQTLNGGPDTSLLD